jgi:hypothetical protein
MEGATDVTSQIVAGTYSTGLLSPSDSDTLTAKVKTSGKAKPGASKSCDMAATSESDTTMKDVVLAKTKVKG